MTITSEHSLLSIQSIARRLRFEYGDEFHHNKRNPLDELILIVCSIKRSERAYLEAYASLKKAFPKYNSLLNASSSEISKVLAPFGMQNSKARTIQSIMTRVTSTFGRPTLSPLKKMNDSECEHYLTSMHGVGLKAARCVMMYSLDRRVFPVDSNCWRISQRLGVVDWTKCNTPSSADMETLQARIPPPLRPSLHKNMVSHGRSICLASRPACNTCVISNSCAYGKQILRAPAKGAKSDNAHTLNPHNTCIGGAA
jgi:endonuclease III